ncbi:MAG: DUF4276 family protein, partial [Patescibacteria group bacterium]|nr:DUF4276 family protein [Patescibacteria group bacterium]
GGVLVVLDGDVKNIGTSPFCARNIARFLANEAKTVGGGSKFSVAVVFARQEYESWLIAGVTSLAGKTLPDGRLVAPNAQPPDLDLEENPRDAKGAIGKLIKGGYRPSRDQETLTDLIDLQAIRDRKLRSFRRLESAVAELVVALREGKHVVTPPSSG